MRREKRGDKEQSKEAGRSLGKRRAQGDGQVTMRMENSLPLLGSRNYVQLVLHLKHVQVYTTSP